MFLRQVKLTKKFTTLRHDHEDQQNGIDSQTMSILEYILVAQNHRSSKDSNRSCISTEWHRFKSLGRHMKRNICRGLKGTLFFFKYISWWHSMDGNVICPQLVTKAHLI
jgi:hypothetical protein